MSQNRKHRSGKSTLCVYTSDLIRTQVEELYVKRNDRGLRETKDLLQKVRIDNNNNNSLEFSSNKNNVETGKSVTERSFDSLEPRYNE